MSISVMYISDFAHIFEGNRNAFGVHVSGDTELKEDAKIRGQNTTKTQLLTEDEYRKHLEGTQSLGVIPITDNSECRFSVIDVDNYIDHTQFIKNLYEAKIPLLPFRSKSGGLHLYLFFDRFIQASKCIQYMKKLVLILGLDTKTEIFPKQTILKQGQTGSWINLPYFNAEKTNRFLVSKEGKPVIFEEAVKIIKENTIVSDKISEIFYEIPLSDAPPCLQSIYFQRDTTHRNSFLFSLARYYKSKFGDDYEFHVTEANNRLARPIDIKRLESTVLSSHNKKDYTYKCEDEPLCSFCDKAECKKRKYGIGGSEVSELSFEDFIQYKTDPPYYEWKINDKKLVFFSEIDIINQRRFQELCFRELHILPARLKEPNWTKIVNTALKNVQVKEFQKGEEISTRSVFIDLLIEFFECRTMAKVKEQIEMGRVYKDQEKNSYIFKAKNLINFVVHQKQFKQYCNTEIHARLKQMGAKCIKYYIGAEKGKIRVWELPFSALGEYLEDTLELTDIELNMEETHDDQPY